MSSLFCLLNSPNTLPSSFALPVSRSFCVGLRCFLYIFYCTAAAVAKQEEPENRSQFPPLFIHVSFHQPSNQPSLGIILIGIHVFIIIIISYHLILPVSFAWSCESSPICSRPANYFSTLSPTVHPSHGSSCYRKATMWSPACHFCCFELSSFVL